MPVPRHMVGPQEIAKVIVTHVTHIEKKPDSQQCWMKPMGTAAVLGSRVGASDRNKL